MHGRGVLDKRSKPCSQFDMLLSSSRGVREEIAFTPLPVVDETNFDRGLSGGSTSPPLCIWMVMDNEV